VADWKQDRIGSALRGENPTVLRRLPSGFAVVGDTQFLPGYCVLLAEPEVAHLSDLSLSERSQFLTDMSLLGEAIERVCRSQGLVRINYEILGNGLPCLHAHVFPRYAWEPEQRRRGPVWLYPPGEFYSPDSALSDAHDGLRSSIGSALDELAGSQ
jgi:diadenosine tetraphosphate (Ap4A) HIT family hydrolase